MSEKIKNAIEIAVQFWVREVERNACNVSQSQLETFAEELRNNLGSPCLKGSSQLDGGCIGYKFENCEVVSNALRSATIDYDSDTMISLIIVPWFNNAKKKTVWLYYGEDSEAVNLGDIVED